MFPQPIEPPSLSATALSRPTTREPLYRPFLLLLIVSFASAAGLVVSFLGQQARIQKESAGLARNLEDTLELSQRIQREVDEQLALLYLGVASDASGYEERFTDLHLQFGEAAVSYLELDIGADERLLVTRIRDRQRELGRSAIALLGRRESDSSKLLPQLARIDRERGDLAESLRALHAFQAGKLQQAIRQSVVALGETRVLFGALAVVFVAAVGGFLVLLRHRVVGPLSVLLGFAGRIQAGDFSARLPQMAPNEIGVLARQLDAMARELGASYSGLEEEVDSRTREVMELQSRLVQSAKLSAIGQLVSGVAHELNNPLTAIMGFSELARSETNAQTIAEHLDVVAQQAQRCRRIVDDLLQFARQRDTKLEPVAVNEVVTRTVRLREYEIATRGLSVELTLDDSNPVIRGDPFKLQQILLILLNNAVDAISSFHDGAGSIEVSTAEVGASVVLEVRDDGGGIEELERIFDPFYTTKPVGRGTGLGLSILYGLVGEHGGEVQAANWQDGDRCGARVTVTIPLAASAEALAATPAVQPQVVQPATSRYALVIDDEEQILMLQCRFLKRLGVEARVAHSGPEAIAILGDRSAHFDLAICDLRMPGGMSGTDVLEWTRVNRPELAGHFLFSSGDLVAFADEQGELEARCLRKPFTYAEYSRAVQELLEVPL